MAFPVSRFAKLIHSIATPKRGIAMPSIPGAAVRTGSRAVRLVQIVDDLRGGRAYTVRHIADRYGISTRQAERDMVDIEVYLLPLEVAGSPLTYRMMRDTR